MHPPNRDRRAALVATLAAVLAALLPSAARAATGTVTVSPPSALAGAPVVITATFAGTRSANLAFGDATSQTIVAPTTVSHVYARSGVYTLSLTDPNGAILATATETVAQPSPRVPFGTIYSSAFTLSPVLAGNDTSILVTYSIATPPGPFLAGTVGLEAIVDLLDAKGQLLRRSDPLAIPYQSAAGGTVQTVTIPYSTPLDASGAYSARVYLRSAGGGTIASGPAMPLLVLAGPDPAPAIHNDFHSSGAIEIGPRAGNPGTTLNTALATVLEWPTYSLGLSGLYDPVSHKSDPVLTLKSSAQGAIGGPDAVSGSAGSPAGGALANGTSYTDVLGRTQAALPALAGGGTTLRGGDATYAIKGTTFHLGYGSTRLASATSGAQFGSIFDLTRALHGDGAFRMSVLNIRDDVKTYVPPGPPGPRVSTSSIFEYSQSVLRNLKATVSGAVSSAQSAVAGGNSVSDASDRVALSYSLGRTQLNTEYDNAGPQMAVAGGPGAQSDRVGFITSASVGLSPVTTLNLGWNRQETRSVFSRQSSATAQILFAPLNLPSLTLGFANTGQDGTGQQQRDHQFTFALSKATSGGAFSLNGSVATVRDALQPAADSVARTAQVQYSRQNAGGHALGIGLSGTSVSGASATATVGQSLTYSFPFGGRVGPAGDVVHGLSLQFSGTNTNVRAAGTGGEDNALDAILSYHVNAHIAVSLHGEATRHNDLVPANSTHASAVRLRMDLSL